VVDPTESQCAAPLPVRMKIRHVSVTPLPMEHFSHEAAQCRVRPDGPPLLP